MDKNQQVDVLNISVLNNTPEMISLKVKKIKQCHSEYNNKCLFFMATIKVYSYKKKKSLQIYRIV